MDVELMKGIASVSGTVSRFRDGRKLVARTYKRTGKTCFYVVDPRRRTKPTKSELKARSSFGAIASEVARRLREGDTRPRSEIWKEVTKELREE